MEMRLSKSDSGRWIEGSGFVRRLLNDDDGAERHQRLVIQLPGSNTLLIAHNLDLAKRVPAGIGDRIYFRGVFEWNDLGGLVHWTHHDPTGHEEGGYVRFRRKVYK